MHAIQANPHAPIRLAEQPDRPLQNLRDQVISDIARKTLNEFLVSITLSGVTCLFIATPAGMVAMIAGTVSMVAINLLIRCAAGYATLCEHDLESVHTREAEQERSNYRTFINFAKYLCPLNFSQVETSTSNTIIHEGGHALAVLALYKDNFPEITISPFEGGVTEFTGGDLSAFGKWLGEERSSLFIAAAGSSLAVLFATAELVAGHTLSEAHPELSRYLEVTGLVGILEHIFYAARGLLSNCGEGHDFRFLWNACEVHPAVCIALMVLLPLIAKIILYAIDCFRSANSQLLSNELNPL